MRTPYREKIGQMFRCWSNVPIKSVKPTDPRETAVYSLLADLPCAEVRPMANSGVLPVDAVEVMRGTAPCALSLPARQLQVRVLVGRGLPWSRSATSRAWPFRIMSTQPILSTFVHKVKSRLSGRQRDGVTVQRTVPEQSISCQQALVTG
jgi:hypothetical protein